jgi:hypothetical protein
MLKINSVVSSMYLLTQVRACTCMCVLTYANMCARAHTHCIRDVVAGDVGFKAKLTTTNVNKKKV